jgi:hypothetical protein
LASRQRQIGTKVEPRPNKHKADIIATLGTMPDTFLSPTWKIKISYQNTTIPRISEVGATDDFRRSGSGVCRASKIFSRFLLGTLVFWYFGMMCLVWSGIFSDFASWINSPKQAAPGPDCGNRLRIGFQTNPCFLLVYINLIILIINNTRNPIPKYQHTKHYRENIF